MIVEEKNKSNTNCRMRNKMKHGSFCTDLECNKRKKLKDESEMGGGWSQDGEVADEEDLIKQLYPLSFHT